MTIIATDYPFVVLMSCNLVRTGNADAGLVKVLIIGEVVVTAHLKVVAHSVPWNRIWLRSWKQDNYLITEEKYTIADLRLCVSLPRIALIVHNFTLARETAEKIYSIAALPMRLHRHPKYRF
jgi:hypothetical protein